MAASVPADGGEHITRQEERGYLSGGIRRDVARK
jgi:hypothetical protein